MYGPISDPKEAAEAIADLLVVNFWTQGAFARTEEGFYLDTAKAPEASCFCALGLINSACTEDAGFHLRKALNDYVNRDSFPTFISYWNDDPARTREQVRQAFLAVASKL